MGVNQISHDTTPNYNNQSFYEDFWIYNKTYNIRLTYGEHISADEEDILKKMSTTLYIIIFVLGIIGNGLVIWIAGFRMKKTVSAVWFLNLAIADFLCCASLPLRITEWVEYVSFSDYVSCQVSVIVFYLNMSVSVLLLTAMSVDRCVSVIIPFWAKVHRTRKLVIFTSAIIWVVGFLVTGLLFNLYRQYYRNINERCYLVSPFSDYIIYITNPAIQLTRLVMMFVIPFLIILVSYVTICFKIRNSKRPRRSQRPYRIITAVVLCFFICWFPYYIWPLIPKNGGNDIQIYFVHIIILNLAGLNSCINPIIYVFMGQDFKYFFFRYIPLKAERDLGEEPNDVWREREDVQHVQITGV